MAQILSIKCESLSVSIALPDDDSLIASGGQFAKSIRFLLEDPLCKIDQRARNHFSLFADYTEIRAEVESPRNIQKERWRKSLSNANAQYLAMIREDSELRAYAWLRIAALNSCILSRHLYSTPGLSEGRRQLYKILSGGQLGTNKGLAAAARHYDAKLRNGTPALEIPPPNVLKDLDVHQNDALTFALIALAPDAIPKRTDHRPRRAWTKSLGIRGIGIPRPPPVFGSGPDLPAEDLYEVPPAIIAPREPNDEPGTEDFEDSPTNADPIGESLIYENWLAEHWAAIHLAGALIPDTDRVLLAAESRAISTLLMEISLVGERHSTPTICALTYLISILACQPRQSVLGALGQLAMGLTDGEKLAAWINRDGFRINVPGAESFGAVRPGTEHCLDPVDQSYYRAWPAFVKASLERLPFNDASIWNQAETVWQEEFKALRSKLITITPRFSEARLQHVLPVALFWKTQDICKAQIATGHLLDHSSAFLHYRYYQACEINECARSAAADWLPPGLLSTGADPDPFVGTTLIGAPRAAIRTDHIRLAVDSLSKRYISYRWHPKGPKRAITVFNLLVTTAAGALAAGTAHRMTYHLGLLTLRDFVLRIKNIDGTSVVSLVILVDKKTDNGLVYRVAVLPNTVVDLIDALIAAIQEIRQEIDDLVGSIEVIDVLNRILRGESSLFQFLHYNPDQDGSVSIGRAQRRQLKANWPALQIPIEHLRHAFTNSACRVGVRPHDVQRQAGHSLHFVSFGPEDPDSPLLFASRNADLIERVIQEQGWKPIGITATAKQPKPTVPTLTLVEVLKIEDKALRHAKSKLDKFRKKSNFFRPLDRKEIKSKVEGILCEHIPGYVSKHPPERIKLDVAAVTRLERGLHQRFDSFEELSVASRHLKKLIRRFLKRRKWTSPCLPRVVFRKSVHLPVITPAAPRAFRTAEAILSWADHELVRPTFTEDPDGIRRPTPLGLLQAIVQLSIRGGLVTQRRLLGCIRALSSVEAYRDVTDAAVLNLNWLSATVLDTETESDSIAEVPAEPAPEAIVLNGACALLAFGWKKAAIDCSGVTLDDLKNACYALPSKFVGSPIDATNILPLLLRVAGLARRLTQPGVRIAWEEDRLAARSLSIEREAMMQADSVRPPPQDDKLGLLAAVSRRPLSKTGDNPDADFLRWMRLRIHDNLKNHSPRLSPAPRLSRHELADSIDVELKLRSGLTNTSKVFASVVMSRLHSARGELSTIYGNLTAILEPFLSELDGADICTLDGNDLAEKVIRAVVSKSTLPRRRRSSDIGEPMHSELVSNAKRTFAQLQHLLDAVVRHGGSEVDVEEFAELDLVANTRGPAYVLGDSEYLRARAQLGHWAFLAEQDGRLLTNYKPVEFRAAQEELTLAFRRGLRAGEANGRRIGDVIYIGDEIFLQVRRHRGAKLKSLSSARTVALTGELTEPEITSFRSWVELRRSAPGKGGHDDARLFDLPQDPDYNPDRIAQLARIALAQTTDHRSKRLHAGRKSIACGGTEIILNRVLPGVLSSHSAFQHPRALAGMGHVEPALQLMYLARSLGQAQASTTLGYYVHTIAFMRFTDSGWPSVTAEVATRLAPGIQYNTLRVSAHRKEITLKGAKEAQLIDLMKLRPEPYVLVPDTFQSLLNSHLPHSRKIRADAPIEHLRLANVIHALMREQPRVHVEASFGLNAETLNEWLGWLQALQFHYRQWILNIDPGTGKATLARDKQRIPRIETVRELCRNCDELRMRDPAAWKSLSRAIRQQRRLDGLLRVSSRDLANSAAISLSQIVGENPRVTDRENGRVELSVECVAAFRFTTLIVVLSDMLSKE